MAQRLIDQFNQGDRGRVEALTFRRGSYCSLHPLTPPPALTWPGPSSFCTPPTPPLTPYYLSVFFRLPLSSPEEKRREEKKTYFPSCQEEITTCIHSCLCMCSYHLFPTPLSPNTTHIPTASYSRRDGASGPERDNGCLNDAPQSFICRRPQRDPLASRSTRRP